MTESELDSFGRAHMYLLNRLLLVGLVLNVVLFVSDCFLHTPLVWINGAGIIVGVASLLRKPRGLRKPTPDALLKQLGPGIGS